MARYIFGGEMPQGAASPDTTNMGTEATPRAALAQVPAGTAVPLYLLNGTAVTDFLLWNSTTSAYDIAATSVTVNSTGTIGTAGRGFQGPDGVTELYDANGNVLLARDRVTGSGTTTWDSISGKPTTFAPSTHTHDDRYYTEGEVDAALAGKAPTSHTHGDLYYTKTEIDAKPLADPFANIPASRILDVNTVPPAGSPTGLYLRRTESNAPPPGASTITHVASAVSTDAAASSANVSATIPAGVAENDFLLAFWGTTGSATTYSLPGWTLVATRTLAAQTGQQERVYMRVAAAGDAGSTVTASVDSASANRQVLAITAYRGAAAVDGWAAADGASGTTHTTPALTTVAASCVGLYSALIRTSTTPVPTLTPGTGLTTSADAVNTGTAGKRLHVSHSLTQVAAGTAIGGKGYTSSAAEATVLWTIALKPTGV